MFYSKYMFVKKGPLSKVWIAAHFHRKLTKPHVQGTDINLSAKTILDPNTPLALRLSGQLLLGLVRIYQRKVKYLLEDCSDALSKMKMIFRPGVVDLPAESAAAPSAAITYADDAEALEYDIPDIPLDNLDEFIAGQDLDQTVAASFDSFSALSGKRNDLTMAADDITLSAFEQDEMDLFAAPDLLEELPADGASIFEDSIEVGRDAGELTALPDFDFDIKADDLAASGRKSDASKRESFLSMGGEFSGLETTDAEGGGFMDGDGDRLSMASGREPPTPVPGFVDEAAERAQAAEVAAATKERKAAQKRKRKAGRKDADTELKSEAIRKHLQDTEELQTERGTVPLAKRAKYDNHWKKVGVRTLLNRPSGLSRSMFDMVEDDALPCNPALLKLFSRTAKLGRAAVPLAEGVEEVEEEGVVAMEEEEGKEEGKEELQPLEFEGDFMFEGGLEGFSAPDDSTVASGRFSLLPTPMKALDETVEAERSLQDAEFWSESAKEAAAEEKVETMSGWSKRTKKMHAMLGQLLKKKKNVSFEAVVEEQPRNVAAGVFYQLLVLKTHNFVDLEQREAFADINISKGDFKQKLPPIAKDSP